MSRDCPRNSNTDQTHIDLPLSDPSRTVGRSGRRTGFLSFYARRSPSGETDKQLVAGGMSFTEFPLVKHDLQRVHEIPAVIVFENRLPHLQKRTIAGEAGI